MCLRENELSFRKNGITYFIALDFNKPLFVKKGKAYFLLLSPEIRTIVSDMFQNDITKRNLILQKITTVYNEPRTRRDASAGFPTIKQVLSDYAADADIPATLCADGILIAKYNNVYYKLHLKSPMTFMKWENGIVSRMSEADVVLIHDKVKLWTYQTLVKWNLQRKTRTDF